MKTNNDAVYPLIASLLLGGLVTLTAVFLFVGEPIEPSTPSDQSTTNLETQPAAPTDVAVDEASTNVSVAEPAVATEVTTDTANDVVQEVAQDVVQEEVEGGTVHTIKMFDYGDDGSLVFVPGHVMAQPGDTVVFEPVDIAHNTKSVLVPDGADNWQSPINEGLTLTLTEEGIYLYICEPHSTLAMAGVIQVGEAVNLEAARVKAEEISQTFLLEKDRLINYLAVADAIGGVAAETSTEVDGADTTDSDGDTRAGGSSDSTPATDADTTPASVDDGSNAPATVTNAPLKKEAAPGAVHIIKMLNTGQDGLMVFEPGFVLAQPGDTIVFEPSDTAHNTQSVLVPEGAEQWQSAINEGITLTLTEEGVYLYLCQPHSALAMAGVIQVGEAVNLQAAQAKVKELDSMFAIGKERLPGYLAQVQ